MLIRYAAAATVTAGAAMIGGHMIGDHPVEYVALTTVRELLRVAGYRHDVSRKGPRERYVKPGRPPITVGHHRGTVTKSEFDRVKTLLVNEEHDRG
jgi:hypothetical protein